MNIRGLSPNPHLPKLTEIKHLLTTTNTDIAALSEINVNWQRVPAEQKLPDLLYAIRVVSCYRPNIKQANKSRSVWSQKHVLLDQLGIDTDPRHLFLTDLSSDVTRWIVAGEQVVVGVDLNEDISSSSIRSTLTRAGLIDICSRRHGRPPPTTVEGSCPIDGIFVTSTLRHCRCGMLDFQGFTNHRPVWIDVPHSLAHPLASTD